LAAAASAPKRGAITPPTAPAMRRRRVSASKRPPSIEILRET
jgi:hypothetical protein